VAPEDWLTLRSARLAARIDPLGAQLSSLQDAGGRELLWHGDPAVWSGRAPVLFPIVGTLAGGSYRLDGRQYALPRHGFARGLRFETVSAAADVAVFRLRADAATLAAYPFRFELQLTFAIAAATLGVTASVRNTGDVALPASVGFHPGFLWPLPFGNARDEHFIEFAATEPEPVRRITAAGLLSAQRHATPVVDRRLLLGDALFRGDVLIFDALRSKSLSYGAARGPRLHVNFPDASHLGIWSKPGAGFICIEPWQGVTDPEGFAADFTRKPGVFSVAPGATRTLHMTIDVRD
jgi:galactose mutarotase-like enzyme